MKSKIKNWDELKESEKLALMKNIEGDYLASVKGDVAVRHFHFDNGHTVYGENMDQQPYPPKYPSGTYVRQESKKEGGVWGLWERVPKSKAP